MEEITPESKPSKYLLRGSVRKFLPYKNGTLALMNDGPVLFLK